MKRSIEDVSHSPTTSLREVDKARIATKVHGSSFHLLLWLHYWPNRLSHFKRVRGPNSRDTDTILDWSEQFELASEACWWSDQVKMFNLATSLKG